MTSDWTEEALRQWLVDYLVGALDCSREQIDRGASMHDLGVGSRDAVVLTGRLSELLDRPVSPVEFWQYPTVSMLARFLTGGEVEPVFTDAGPRLDRHDPIAIVGVGCRFPGGVSSLDELWDFLEAGRSGIREVPIQRWSRFADGSPADAAVIAETTRWGGYLEDVADFDAEYFEIPAGEADKMDPQQRLLLEVTHEALENAGISPQALRHTQTGVFAGACNGEYGALSASDLSSVDAWSGTGGGMRARTDIICARMASADSRCSIGGVTTASAVTMAGAPAAPTLIPCGRAKARRRRRPMRRRPTSR